ncbi:calcineurin subunit B [Klebsormidium nitens]|uniref:Calcineurin subunit B n=1 Tax=Klebsormidium nitens TaxID=105231 RepID=A0A1Y1I6F5_KLENI|nr:calcineurin subunit B [Klebsormidium nitens]|eukprot:GAQ86535.1 calcineurin subunit B [Klebsormidium nitens]
MESISPGERDVCFERLAAGTKAAIDVTREGGPEMMGSAASVLTQYDIEEVQVHCNGAFSQKEIESLYKRFCALDRGGKGYLTGDEVMSIPEFALNPIHQRLLVSFEGVNFKDFCGAMAAFSSRASMEKKLRFVFNVYDATGKGTIGREDMLQILRDMTGSFLTEEQRQRAVTRALEEAGFSQNPALTFSDFSKVMGTSSFSLEVEVPTLD